jgi:hypothetical protein
MKKIQKIRMKTNPLPCLFREGERISRDEALLQIRRHMIADGSLHPDVLRLIELFHIEPEELSEAGLPYESLKALEKYALFI